MKKAYYEGEGRAAVAFNLARYYHCGYKRIVDRNPEKAASLYRIALNKGIDEAQYYIGLMQAVGDGIKQDSKEAQNILEKLADSLKDKNNEAKLLVFAIHKFGLLGQEKNEDLAESLKETMDLEEGYADVAENFLYKKIFKGKTQLNNNDFRSFYYAKLELQKREYDNRYKNIDDAEKDFEKLFDGYKSGKHL